MSRLLASQSNDACLADFTAYEILITMRCLNSSDTAKNNLPAAASNP